MKTFILDIINNVDLSYRDITDQLASLLDCHEITEQEYDEAIDYMETIL